ncbi:MlaD family protein [Nocardia sp. NPDC047648]|uniref:MlaD family protein n=1 Tax=Nocardia sp. NPDC047648 TaxID=3155625 RepID=UPI00340B375D
MNGGNRRRAGRIGVLAFAATVSASCAFDPATVPLPGARLSGETYSVRIEFANALNLPAGARVMSSGVRIGTLDSVRVVDPTPREPGMAVAEVEILRTVRLSAATTAQLRQNTVLGDIHIELTVPAADTSRELAPGAVIPLARSQPATQVEDIMSGIASFVGTGAMGHARDIVSQVGAAMPPDPADTARIAQVLGADLADISANLDQVTALGLAFQDNLRAIEDNSRALGELLTPEGAQQVSVSAASVVELLGVIGGLGGIAHSIEWLAPLAASGDAAAEALMPLLFTARPFDTSAPSNLAALVALLRDKVIPFAAKGPKVNVAGVGIDGVAMPEDEQLGRMIGVLRMIGMVR